MHHIWILQYGPKTSILNSYSLLTSTSINTVLLETLPIFLRSENGLNRVVFLEGGVLKNESLVSLLSYLSVRGLNSVFPCLIASSMILKSFDSTPSADCQSFQYRIGDIPLNFDCGTECRVPSVNRFWMNGSVYFSKPHVINHNTNLPSSVSLEFLLDSISQQFKQKCVISGVISETGRTGDFLSRSRFFLRI